MIHPAPRTTDATPTTNALGGLWILAEVLLLVLCYLAAIAGAQGVWDRFIAPLFHYANYL